MPNNNSKVAHYETNLVGRDFVCGDLHGCYEDLMKALDLLGFNRLIDRLFSVGDLIDRGPDSLQCAALIYEIWFILVPGNHEQLMVASTLDNSSRHTDCWNDNGGIWHHSEDKTELKQLSELMKDLPLVITVGSGEARFNIVHAELIHTNSDTGRIVGLVTDETIDNWLFSVDDEEGMTWGRTLITNGKAISQPVNVSKLVQDMDKLSLTFVGHTPVREVVQVQKQMYIDTGAVFSVKPKSSEQNHLTFACPAEKMLYQYNMVRKTISTVAFDDVPKMH